MNTAGKRALYDNLGKDEALALAVDAAVRKSQTGRLAEQPVQVKEGAERDQGGARSTKPARADQS